MVKGQEAAEAGAGMSKDSLPPWRAAQGFRPDAESFVHFLGERSRKVRIGVKGIQVHKSQTKSLVFQQVTQGIVLLVCKCHVAVDVNTEVGDSCLYFIRGDIKEHRATPPRF